MISQKYNSEEEWLEARLGKVTGTRLGDVTPKRGGGKRIGFYEIIAERVAIPANGENVMDRGHRLEIVALERFAQETGKEVDGSLVIWSREDHPDIAVSPDGVVAGEKEAVEVKCLSSARHIEAWLTKKVPDDYEYQVLQYFIVNEQLETLYFTFYDPRMPKDFFYLTITRESKQKEIDEYFEIEKQVLVEIDQIVNDLTF